jgi:hypothetical protein
MSGIPGVIPANVRALIDRCAGDRELSLLLYGSYSDMRPVPCERCGTTLVLMEEVTEIRDDGWFGRIRPHWFEVTSQTSRGMVEAAWAGHDPQRCRLIRERTYAPP